MNSKWRSLTVLITGMVLGLVLALGQGVWAERETLNGLPLPLDELKAFTQVFSKIKSDYVEQVDDRQLLKDAIRGMLNGLDPHSTYLDETAYKDLRIGTTGEFGGLGIEVGMEDSFVKVIAPIDDTPAQRAGVKSGDLIIRLDETPVKGLSLTDAVKLMRGKPGTDILLTIVREGEEKPLKITITRAVIKVKSVKQKTLEKGYGYLRITQFQARTGENLLDAISELKKANNNDLKGVILDLRNNPGGVLSAAVAVSDAFLTEGLIVYTKGRQEDSQLKFNATPSDMLKGKPVIVLVNGGSASASEIVAGALQDHKRAIIMGKRTFGKGSVQTIMPMSTETALKLTTARYYTPSGRSIQAEGIEPDITLEDVRVAKVDTSDFSMIKEADLSGHLDNGNSKKQKSDSKDKKEELSLASKDYQLYEALNLLKGMQILHSRNNK
ncbi:MAG: S41 family peptidase [Gammaproteobacteria bacterium]|nr:S41 family peptidase [Gammaproteobacteria bacterium]